MNKKIVILLVLIISLLLIPGIQPYTQATIFSQTTNPFENQNELELFRIRPPIDMADLPREAEIVGGNPGVFHDILMYEYSIKDLHKNNYDVERVEDNEDSSILPLNSNSYHTLEEMEQTLFEIAEEYENITSLFTIGKSYQDRDIWCLEITDNPGENEEEPGVLFLGLHHAREWPTLEIALHIAENLTDQYYKDTKIQNLVNNRRIWIVPCVNPDGYYYCYEQGHDWRKNRHYLEDYQTYGIDLNRNYAGSTNGEPLGMWGSTGMSHNPESSTYCGETQFSELETQAVEDFFKSHMIHSCISWHTYSELVMWPWGYDIDAKTPDNEYMSEVGIEMASRITKQSGSGTYLPHQSAGLYPTTGDTTDWMYGYSHYVLGRTCFTYTIEACSSFHPSAGVMGQVCEENMDGALYLLEESYNISQIPQRVIPPTINEITELDDTYMLSWEPSNENHNTTKYELQELKDMYQYTDTTMVSPEGWILDGFTSETKRYNSEPISYQSHTDSRTVSVMTTKYPTYITDSIESVSFNCWYDIIEKGNEAFFEISTNGRDFKVIDTFTGQSTEWETKEYSLEEYKGQSIILRFRYAKSAKNFEEGFYVDDITPVTTYYTVNTLNNTIQNQEYIISEDDMDNSYVRIRGYNQDFGWGDWSQLLPLQRMQNGNNPPSRPSIQGPENPEKGETCTYTVYSIDPNGDKVYYLVSWGDGTTEEWKGPYNSGEEVTFTHTWESRGEYQIKVRSKDDHDMTSDWATLEVAAPKFGDFSTIWDILYSYLSLFFNILN